MPSNKEVSKRPGRPAVTSRDKIVDCVLKMLEREGHEALTFRAVARELKLTVGGLACYFKTLADLEDEAAAKIISSWQPLKRGKADLRKQLTELGLQMLETNRTHPYLVQIRGPASAAVVARHTSQCLNVLLDAGIPFDRAVAAYSIVGNLAFAWSIQTSRRDTPDDAANIQSILSREMGDLSPRMHKLLSEGGGKAIYRKWFALSIDSLLDASTVGGKRP